MKDNKFTMIDESGQEREYDVLFTFESEETNKNYIVYTDNTKDETGNVEVYASIYSRALRRQRRGQCAHRRA